MYSPGAITSFQQARISYFSRRWLNATCKNLTCFEDLNFELYITQMVLMVILFAAHLS